MPSKQARFIHIPAAQIPSVTIIREAAFESNAVQHEFTAGKMKKKSPFIGPRLTKRSGEERE